MSKIPVLPPHLSWMTAEQDGVPIIIRKDGARWLDLNGNDADFDVLRDLQPAHMITMASDAPELPRVAVKFNGGSLVLLSLDGPSGLVMIDNTEAEQLCLLVMRAAWSRRRLDASI